MVQFVSIDAAVAAIACALLAACLPGPGERADSGDTAGSSATAALPPLQDHRDVARTAGLSPIVTLGTRVDAVSVFGLTEFELLLEPPASGPWTLRWTDLAMRFVVRRADAGRDDARDVSAQRVVHVNWPGSNLQLHILASFEAVHSLAAAGQREDGDASARGRTEFLSWAGSWASDDEVRVELDAGVRLRTVLPFGMWRSAERDVAEFAFDSPSSTHRVHVEQLVGETWVPISNTIEIRTLAGEPDRLSEVAARIPNEAVPPVLGRRSFVDRRDHDVDLQGLAERSGGETTALGQFLLVTDLEARVSELRGRLRTNPLDVAGVARPIRSIRQRFDALGEVKRCQPERTLAFLGRLAGLEASVAMWLDRFGEAAPDWR